MKVITFDKKTFEETPTLAILHVISKKQQARVSDFPEDWNRDMLRAALDTMCRLGVISKIFSGNSFIYKIPTQKNKTVVPLARNQRVGVLRRNR